MKADILLWWRTYKIHRLKVPIVYFIECRSPSRNKWGFLYFKQVKYLGLWHYNLTLRRRFVFVTSSNLICLIPLNREIPSKKCSINISFFNRNLPIKDVNNWTLSIEYYYVYSKEMDTRDTRGTILYKLHMVWQKKVSHATALSI